MEAITRQNHLPRHKDEQDDSRLHHPVDKSRKQLRLITVEGMQRRSEERFKSRLNTTGIRCASYLLNCWWVRTSPSSLIGKHTSQLATMFWILNSRKRAGKPSFCTTRAYFRAARRDCSSLHVLRHRREGDYALTQHAAHT